MELRFTVWQFVRLMVYLEDARDLSDDQHALLADWQAVWSDLDETLGELAQSDPEAYGALMMDQDVVFDAVTPRQGEAARAALDAVMKQIDSQIDASTDRDTDEDLLQSLKFERRELRQLARKIARQCAQTANDDDSETA